MKSAIAISSRARASGLRCTTSLLSLAVAVAATGAASAQQLPTGGTVTTGSATISQTGPNLIVTQTSRNAILSWQSFSIGGSASAHFENGTGATLNRVTGSLPSSIDGSLTATGSLYLINPAGVAVGTGGMVRTGGSFVASTHDTTDADFLDGGGLTLKGDSKAGVVNRGTIVSRSGDVVLTARRVENSGDIQAPNGSVGLLGGYEIELRDTSLADGKFAVKVGGGDTEVANSGSIRAAEVELRANGGNVQALAGNTRKIIKATGVKKVGGRIFLTAGDGGAVTVTQRVVARRAVQPAQKEAVAALPDFGPLPAARPGFSGGEVHVAGGTVSLGGEIDTAGSAGAGGTITATAAGGKLSLSSTAALDASGDRGGLILLGGDYQGGSDPATRYLGTTLARAVTVTVEAGATIAANGRAGDGGNVVVWSDGRTDFAGTISAKGDSKGGNAEVSGKAVLAYTGFADLSAANGAFGTLLLDPYNVTISSGTDTLGSGPGFTANANNSVINVATLQAALAGANVIVLTGAGGGQAGDITVAAPISWSSGSTLTLDAYHSIAINAPVTIAGAGGLNLVTNHGGSGGTLSFSGGVQYTGAPGSGQSLAINGQSYTLLYSMSDLQGINNGLNGRYALARSLDATGVAGWVPLGTDGGGAILNSGNGFAGTFSGLGNTIKNLNVDIGNNNNAGLFGYSSGVIGDIGLIGGSIKGGNYVGGLVGAQYGGSIARAYATGAVTGVYSIGGLVGILVNGSVTQAYATGQVTGNESVGGLVGGLGGGGGITQAYATGAVTGVNTIGGLVGLLASGSVTQAYATGKVTGDGYEVGGLVGYQYDGSIMQAYATGRVTGTIASSVGGLVGSQSGGTVASSYFDTFSTGQAGASGAGNLAGVAAVTSDPTQAGAANYAYKQSAYSSLSFTTTPGGNGWYMIDGQTRPFGAWEYSTSIVNGHQLQLVNMDLNASYRLARGIDLGPGLAPATVNGNITYAGMWRLGSFVPLGTDGAGTRLNSGNGFAGAFDGLGNTITNLNVDIGNYNFAGLFGFSRGTIRDVGLVGGSVKGSNNVGGLVGFQGGGGITRAYSSGDVGGNFAVGGLVGYRAGGSVAQVYAAGSVKGTDSVGGLVGVQTYGVIAQAYATGSVKGTEYVGGLVGLQYGSIYQAYATGDVSGSYSVGGLVGEQRDSDGRIEQAYATGMVAGASNAVGGLVGSRWDGNAIIDSYFDKFSTGQSLGVGDGSQAGLTAVTSDPMQAGAVNYAYKRSVYAGFDWTVWAPPAAAADSSPAYYPELYGVSGVVGVEVTSNGSQTYGETSPNYSGAVTYFGLEYWNSMGVPIQISSNATAHSNVGSNYSVTASEGSATRIQGGAARLVYLSNTGTFSVTPATLTVTVHDNFKVYDGQAWSGGNWVSYDGFVAGEDASVLDGGIVWGGTAMGAKNAGTYTFTASGITSSNYDITYVSGTLTIGKASLTVTANDAAKTYDGLTWSGGNGVIYSGFVAGEDASALGGALAWGGTAQGQKNAGSYTLAASGLTSGNYDVAYVDSTLDIGKATLTVAANAASKVYGNLDPTLGYMASGFKFSDDETLLSGALSRAAGENVGGYSIGLGSLSAGGNYTIAYTGANLAITPATLTVAANVASKIYGNLDPTLGYMASGFKFSDDETLLSGALSRAAGENVGGYSIGLGSLSAGGNYTIAYTGANLAITPATLTVAANAASKIYGNADPTLGYTASGFKLSDDETLLSGALGRAAGENVGGYAIDVGSLSAGGNYTIAYTGANLAITPRAITVTADNRSRLQGQADPVLTWTVTGGSLASSDTIAGAFSGNLARDPGETVGTYAIGQGSLDANSNYALTFVAGAFTIGPAQTAGPYTNARGLERQGGQRVPLLLSPLVLSSLLLSDAADGNATGTCAWGVLGPECAAFIHPANHDLGPYMRVTE
ncbi:MBG domain-containing protein [Mesorhizobium comanense]|uniref:MBG domain-containing protein n=1 Tax=Mesorhizobium comanense TaxID=2502215 RepID=UPI0010F791A5|nr:MBG domain-containing protein [Mesorhizobium comanense]